jgi:hypothetical protein
MSSILSNQVARGKVELFSAFTTGTGLDSNEILYLSVIASAFDTSRTVVFTKTLFKGAEQVRRGFLVGNKVQMLNFLPNNPIGHRIYIAADNLAS